MVIVRSNSGVKIGNVRKRSKKSQGKRLKSKLRKGRLI
jgi:hypothetical protein